MYNKGIGGILHAFLPSCCGWSYQPAKLQQLTLKQNISKVITTLEENQLVCLRRYKDSTPVCVQFGIKSRNIPITASSTYNYLTSDTPPITTNPHLITLRITKVKLKRSPS